MVIKKEDHTNLIIGIVCVNLATFVWATNMALGRWLKDDIGPLSLSAGRFIVASFFFALLLRHLPPKERRIGEDRWPLIAMAITGTALFSPVLYFGLHYTTAVNSTIINALSPLLTGIVAGWLIRERLSVRQATGAITGLIGVVILISGGPVVFRLTASLNIGDLIVFVAVIIWAFYSVFASKVMRHRSSFSATALSTFIGTPFLCLFAVSEIMSVSPNLGLKTVLSIIYLGIFPAAIGFYAWNKGVKLLGPGRAAIFVNTLPLYGAALGFIFLDESIGPEHLIGGALIVCGGIMAAKNGGKRLNPD
jgi:drug/metabolite transporter (DMT)-like permease